MAENNPPIAVSLEGLRKSITSRMSVVWRSGSARLSSEQKVLGSTPSSTSSAARARVVGGHRPHHRPRSRTRNRPGCLPGDPSFCFTSRPGRGACNPPTRPSRRLLRTSDHKQATTGTFLNETAKSGRTGNKCMQGHHVTGTFQFFCMQVVRYTIRPHRTQICERYHPGT